MRGAVAEGDVVTQCVGRRPLTFAGGVGVALLFPRGSDAILCALDRSYIRGEFFRPVFRESERSLCMAGAFMSGNIDWIRRSEQ